MIYIAFVVDLLRICMDLLWICIGFGIDLYDLQLPHPTLHLICACACDAICVFGSSNFNTVNVNVIAEALDDVKGVRALDVRCVSIWKSFVCIYNAIV
jgi:hypothetical protein